ncbi:Cilia- and flagella-associated protein 57 [Borealophlyctis nickersoniae]|nr:Cilia- and flagella-associated protein 57 [Borealophlyctis nickersoniae]
MSIASVAHSHVFGIKSDIPENLFYVDDNTVLYPAGRNIIVWNMEQKTQRFIPTSEKGEAISAVTVSSDRHIFAMAERAERGTINLYDVHSFRKRRTLQAAEGFVAKEFTQLAFSSDSKYILAQLGPPEWLLHYFAWEKGKLVATFCTSPVESQRVRQISINPSDGTEMCVVGEAGLKMYRYGEGGLRGLEIRGLPNRDYLSHAWIATDRLAAGTSVGSVVILQSLQVTQELLPTPESLITSARFIIPLARGFAVGGAGGQVILYERHNEMGMADRFKAVKRFAFPDENAEVRCMAASASEGILLAEVMENQVFKISLLAAEFVKQGEDPKFEPLTPPYHHGQITGMDLCIRKPLFVTCSSDRSIRVWNYFALTCDLVKYFPEEPHSVALHPSGLYILVGFSDKLRLMNVLIDDLRLFREFGIRGCRECRFSPGGHLFAAVHGNMIQIYSTWTFDNIGNLKGHNGKVRSLHWTADDKFLVSAGSDGAVYTWNVKDLKRENEHILKSCAYSAAVCGSGGKVVWAVGSDKMLKEITDSTVTCEVESDVVLTQITLSHSGRMMFAGTSQGTIRSIKFPLSGNPDDFQEHQAHAAPVTRLRVSYDDQYLFSAAEDGTLYMFRISDKEDRAIKKDKPLTFADEILITKSDLEEKTLLMSELQRNLEELKLEHEYQLRLKDMTFNEKLKEITERYSQEIEALKISTSVLRTEKDKEEVKHEEEMGNLVGKHQGELHDIESKYNQELMEEYERFQAQQTKTQSMQELWQKEMKEFEIATRKALAETQAEAENRLNQKTAEIQRVGTSERWIAQFYGHRLTHSDNPSTQNLLQFKQEIHTQLRDFDEMSHQNAEDIDTEISLCAARYERKLRGEREEGARLKGENGIMRKKFNTLNKDIEDNKAEIARMREDEKKLRAVIAGLEKEIGTLKKEMSERDELIQDKERRVYDLKKKNQELEKFKFVLDYRIKELKEKVEPRENTILDMTRHIHEISQTLEAHSKSKAAFEEQIADLEARLDRTKEDLQKEHTKAHQGNVYIRGFKVDLEHCVQFIQEPAALKKSAENLFRKYISKRGIAAASQASNELRSAGIDPEVRREYLLQHDVLRDRVAELRVVVEKNSAAYRTDSVKSMTENQALIA